MRKERFEIAELEVIKFQSQDVILTSFSDYEEDETPLMPNKQN